MELLNVNKFFCNCFLEYSRSAIAGVTAYGALGYASVVVLNPYAATVAGGTFGATQRMAAILLGMPPSDFLPKTCGFIAGGAAYTAMLAAPGAREIAIYSVASAMLSAFVLVCVQKMAAPIKSKCVIHRNSLVK